jgi:hypothetical protein
MGEKLRVTAKTYWVWTEKAQAKKPCRKAGEPIWEYYRQGAPVSWVEKGYVKDAGEAEE